MGIKSSPHRPLVLMLAFARLYHCSRCHAQVIICQNCDHGNRYCFGGCAELARQVSLKRASKKYFATRQGRIKNAARQQACRDRKKQIVTHQGSQQTPSHDVLENIPQPPEKCEKTPDLPFSIVCHRCGCQCEPFLRLDVMAANRFIGKLLYQ
jgi:hypothetical protein